MHASGNDPHHISTTQRYIVNARPKLHRTPERKCTIWLDLAGVKLRQLVGFRFVHGPARRSAPTKQRSFAGKPTGQRNTHRILAEFVRPFQSHSQSPLLQ